MIGGGRGRGEGGQLPFFRDCDVTMVFKYMSIIYNFSGKVPIALIILFESFTTLRSLWNYEIPFISESPSFPKPRAGGVLDHPIKSNVCKNCFRFCFLSYSTCKWKWLAGHSLLVFTSLNVVLLACQARSMRRSSIYIARTRRGAAFLSIDVRISFVIQQSIEHSYTRGTSRSTSRHLK